ncbi:MAG: prephenate dehydrogenase/arogenate dehydrogenase family protein [Pseudomonadales bacterium]|nr:prephenate dehydrogenase/arogenate dehydrogenase family protein [Pseudomonadales bacterium]
MSNSNTADQDFPPAVSNDFYMVENTLVIGLGMIGGSLAKALKENGFSRKVVAYDSSVEALKIGVKLGVIDSGCTDIGMAVRQASVIILAVPVKATASVLKMIKPYLQPECIISDVGSTKGSVIKAAEAVFGTVPANFVPAHPIAGSEKSGVEAANSQLFAKHKVIITPHDHASA